jgi:hypothetical protein
VPGGHARLLVVCHLLLGATPNCWRCQRENALGVEKPSGVAISASGLDRSSR